MKPLTRLSRALRVSDPAHLDLETLGRATRARLLDVSRLLGLKGVSRLRKGGLAGRIWETLADDVKALRRKRDEKARQNVAAQKFSLGDEKADKESRKPPEHIPWSYGQSRVRAMAVDPERLYTYWEVTDEAIALARAQLGPGGDSGWLNLRVYDTTGRLFDGTNPHGYFDHRVDRGDRQWFFTVGRPASEAFVEIGMKSYEGDAAHAPWTVDAPVWSRPS